MLVKTKERKAAKSDINITIQCRWPTQSEAVQSVVRDTAEDTEDLYTQSDLLDKLNAVYVDGKKIQSVA